MNAPRHHLPALGLAVALLAPSLGLADDSPIASLSGNGELTFSCPSPNLTYVVEWASSPDGPWSSSWDDLFLIEPGAASSVTMSVPMFYRVMTPAHVQSIEVVDAAEAASIIEANQGASDFKILDVRTASEYGNDGRIIGAINVDYYNPTLEQLLRMLPRHHRYLIYCRSSGRSGNVRSLMQTLGFHTVWDLDLGFANSGIASYTHLVES